LFVIFVSQVVYGENEIKIIIDDEVVIFTEEYGYPFIDENNRTQVPLRTSLEHFGAEVGWIAEQSTATVKLNDIFIEVPIGESYIMVNGRKVENDTKALIKNGRTYLPLRVVFESLDASVSWESKTKSIQVKKEDYGNNIGQFAQNIEGVDHNGNNVSLGNLRGKKTLLTYFSTW
jgi:hypothetical protein